MCQYRARPARSLKIWGSTIISDVSGTDLGLPANLPEANLPSAQKFEAWPSLISRASILGK